VERARYFRDWLTRPNQALLGAALAETIGIRPTLWVLPIGGAVVALW